MSEQDRLTAAAHRSSRAVAMSTSRALVRLQYQACMLRGRHQDRHMDDARDRDRGESERGRDRDKRRQQEAEIGAVTDRSSDSDRSRGKGGQKELFLL